MDGRFGFRYSPTPAEEWNPMKFLVIAALMTTGALRADRANMELPIVEVSQSGANSDLFVMKGRAAATVVMQGIGIKLLWRSEQECRRSTNCIKISVLSNAPAEDQPGALAYAKVYQGRQIVVFGDRVVGSIESRRAPILLGHVIAHEIVHILQGVAHHSESGLMKAHWNGKDYGEMTRKPLQVTELDHVLIRNGITLR